MLVQTLDANIEFWTQQHNSIQPYIDKYVLIRDKLYNEHKEQSVSAVTLRLSALSSTEADKHEIFLKSLFLKVQQSSCHLQFYS